MYMEFANCDRSLYLEILSVRVESIPADEYSPENTTVRFDFKYKARYDDWFLPEDSTQQQFLGRKDGNAVVMGITLTREQVLSTEAGDLLDEYLGGGWPLCNLRRRFVIGYGLGRVRHALVGDMPSSGFGFNRRVSIPLYVLALHRHVYIPCGVYMVPTEEEAIEALRIKEITTAEDASQTCVICIDEFRDEQVREMPCSHFFHGECIKRWLRTSHYCPCCRFQMPVQ